MLIESAFFNLPEILLLEETNNIFEDSLRNMFSLSLLLEFNARNAPYPIERIKLEKRYPLNNKNKCDLFVSFKDMVDKVKNKHFGMCEENWIEIKYFGGFGRRSKGVETVTENIGKILNDILRLCLFVDELQGNIRKNGRYLICIFDRKPKEYLANLNNLHWLNNIFGENVKEIDIDSNNLKPSTKKVIKSFNVKNLQIKLWIDTKSFYPLTSSDYGTFYGFLIKIFAFEVILGALKLEYSDFTDISWDNSKKEIQNQILKTLIRDKY